MLSVHGLEAGHGDSRVLFGIGLAVNAGEVVTLLGAEWHGQDHDGPGDHGHPAPARRGGAAGWDAA